MILPKQRKKALVLSGGGGRGAYHIGALQFLHEHEWFPDVVVGTSIGAVNGAAIASGHDARSLWALWRRLKTEDVQMPHLNIFDGAYLLDTNPLRETLTREGWINFERINSPQSAVHLRITATEVDTGNLSVFGNSPDLFPSKLFEEEITLDHILSSCSIPLVYPPTQIKEHTYWDGATVSNTPLSAAIDAGAEEIVVVLMTPWGEDETSAVSLPGSLIQAASLALDWSLLASFRSDLKTFRRVNEMVKLRAQNARLRAILKEITSKMGEASAAQTYQDLNQDGIPDIFEDNLRVLSDPLIVAPQKPIPAEQIISYTPAGHEKMYQMGYEDAKRAWGTAGRVVEGE